MSATLRKVLVTGLLFFAFAAQATVSAATTWHGVVHEMEKLLDQAVDTYQAGDASKARDLVNDAYFSFYEKEGMERAVMSYISGKRAAIVEYQFSTVKKKLLAGAPQSDVEAEFRQLVSLLREDATQLDGKEHNSATVFLSSFFILLREGVEAILVIGAIIAFLIRSGNAKKTRVVYAASLVALAASFLTALVIQQVLAISGANQEIMEGVTMLSAVLVLFFVSHWMVGKAESKVWQNYIEGKVQASVSSGSSFALGLAAFLAVYREGAETVFFYQALLIESGKESAFVWVGFGAGALALAAVFLLVRFGSVRLPLRPFFIGTGVLMYVMAVAFAGGGIKELQEADVVSVTPVPGLSSVDVLGIYPTWETLLPQIVLLLAALVAIPWYLRKGKKSGTQTQA